MAKRPGQDYATASLRDYLEALASKTATPGGGSAAAVTGALGISLVEMVARINRRRVDRRSGRRKPTASPGIRELGLLRRQVLRAATRDAAAFKRLAKVYRQGRRAPSFQKATLQAAKVPLGICVSVSRASGFAKKEFHRAGPWLRADAVEAGFLLNAAFRSAKLHAAANAGALTNAAARGRLSKALKKAEKTLSVNLRYALLRRT